MAKAKKTPGRDATAGTDEQHALHPRRTPVLYGHRDACKIFERSVRSGKLHHAWLLNGERGIGKSTFAYAAARFLLNGADAGARFALNEPALQESAVSRQIAAGAHPCLASVTPPETATAARPSIGVDEVRKLRGFLSLTSPGGWRVAIVDDVNHLTSSSANALLKAIEEPPARTVFLLVNHGAGAILPTIRSRCIRLDFKPLGEADLRDATLAALSRGAIPHPGAETLHAALMASGGSPGMAVPFLRGDLLPLAQAVQALFSRLPDLDPGLLRSTLAFASKAKQADGFETVCDIIEEGIEREARRRVQSSLHAAGAFARSWVRFRERRLDLEALNLDKGAFLIAAFSDIENSLRDAAHMGAV